MKTITKAKRFIERMDNVESLSERQLVELLYRAKEIVSEYIVTEDKKEAAYIRLKQETNYRTSNTAKEIVVAKSTPKNVVTLEVPSREGVINNTIEDAVAVSNEVDNTISIEAGKEEHMSAITIHNINYSKEIILGSYVANNERTFFSMSKKYSHPVVFGKPALTNEVLAEIQKQMPEYGTGVTKDLKSVSYFGKFNGEDVMVSMIDFKREVFEGYIGDQLFTTTSEYLNKGYRPLVTSAHDFVINNKGKHNSAAFNSCTDDMANVIIQIINQYKASDKFKRAMKDTEYINAKKKNKPKNVVTLETAAFNVPDASMSTDAEAIDFESNDNTYEDKCSTATGVYINELGLADPAAILQSMYQGGDSDWEIEF